MFTVLYIIMGVYTLAIIGSVILLILKIVERKKEKKREDITKYKDY